MAPTTSSPLEEIFLTPADHTPIMIDFQSQVAFAMTSIDAVHRRNTSAVVAAAAVSFDVPTILTSVTPGPMLDEVTTPLPKQPLFDRTFANIREDAAVINRVNEIGRRPVVPAVCGPGSSILDPALSALDQGFEVDVTTDACGAVTTCLNGRSHAWFRQVSVRSRRSDTFWNGEVTGDARRLTAPRRTWPRHMPAPMASASTLPRPCSTRPTATDSPRPVSTAATSNAWHHCS